ncbi:exonuclease domain-containing protein [Poseidonocella sp. HB161398]|uniref:3'-5' exonuclease n=1 Tax=Poseidonocella sp. HB161398 TaxID=2320855 RepID=UPI0011095D9B|nr:exonuclease domain-containing protein [Poseidonocella sp. HB161398]
MLSRLSLRLRIFLFFCLLGFGSLAILAGAAALALSRAAEGGTAGALLTAGLVAGFAILGLTVFVWRLFDENVARPIGTVAAALRARAHGGVHDEIEADVAVYLGDLAPAASAVAGTLAEARGSVARAVEEQTAALTLQTEKLKALVSDVPVGLIVVSPAHQIVFYNTPAREMLSGTGRPRLGRPVFDLLREGPIRKTYERLRATGTDDDDAEILVSTTGCARALSAHIRLIRKDLGMTHESPGYVLTLRDVTAALSAHRERERLLHDLVERLRLPAGRLKALVEVAADRDPAALPADLRARALELTDEVQAAADAYDANWRSWWPLGEVRAAELIDGLRAHLDGTGPALEARPPELILTCDGVAMVDLLAALARAVAAADLAAVVSLAIAPDEPGAELRLSWQGEPMSPSLLEEVLARPLDPETDMLTGREVLDRHGSDIWPEWDHQGTSWLTVPLHAARPVPAVAPRGGFVPERNAVYDFDLLAHTDHAGVDATPLARLTYVIFDTETTGLDPNGGDEIVQIAALRAVNGRLVPGEVIDQLVDPGRAIPPGSTRIHGITDQMVRGQPGIAEAGAYFHRFSRRAVLVAHNAPFDMAFFHRHAPAIGAAFDNPVLDTVLLSAILFGQQEEHTLDALAARFGVTIPEEARHTALGDTQATAEVFLRMIPMLEAKGLVTYGDVLAAMSRNSRLMREMAARVG